MRPRQVLGFLGSLHSAHRAVAGGVDGDERFSHRTLSAAVPSVFHGDGLPPTGVDGLGLPEAADPVAAVWKAVPRRRCQTLTSMRILITGICGFVGSTLAHAWAERGSGHELYGIDNFVRPGSEINRQRLRRLGVKVIHGDIRLASDFETLPDADWLIDAAANPS